MHAIDSLRKFGNSHVWLLVLGAFCLIVFVFFYQTILRGMLPIPSDALVGLYHPYRDLYHDQFPRGIPFKNFLITDPVRQQIPWRKIAIDEMKRGSLPMWNPYAFSGTPLLGNIQSGTLYPLNILFFAFPFDIAWTILIISQPLLAGVFLLIYLKHLKLHPFACLAGAISWSFCGFAVSWLTWGTMVATALWLPIILLAIDNTRVASSLRQRISWLLLGIICLSAAFLAGHIQIFLYVVIVSVLYGIYRFSKNQSNRVHVPINTVLFIFLLLLSIFFLTLVSLQGIELLKLITLTGRLAEEGLYTKEGWFLPVQHLVQFLVPDFFGNPATLNYWGTWNYGELTGYIGVIPFLLALYGIFFSSHKDKKLWGVLSIVTLVFLLPTPIARIPYVLHLPVLSNLQPTRLLMITSFCFVILGALGFDSLLQEKRKKNGIYLFIGVGMVYIILFGICFGYSRLGNISSEMVSNLLTARRNLILPFCIFVFGFTGIVLLEKKRIRNIGIILLLILVSFDLLRFGSKFTPFTLREYFFPKTKILSYLTSQQSPVRVLATDDRILPPNVAAYYGIEMPSGYDPLFSKYYEVFTAAEKRNSPNISPPYGFNRIVVPSFNNSPLFPYYAVTHILTLEPINQPNVQLVMKEGETHLYAFTSPTPRFFFADQVIRVKTQQEIYEKLYSPENKNKYSAVLDENIANALGNPSSQDSIQITQRTLSSTIIKTSTQSDQFLFISENYHPFWTAKIDGKNARIYRINGTFMGLVVPSGTHTVVLSYEIFH